MKDEVISNISRAFQDNSWAEKLKELDFWDKKILEKSREFGLNPYDQEFEICDYEQMIGYLAYSGMPSHYPHWSYGKAYERLRTMYDYGVSGLPYELVINANPALAYLMRDNSLALQILTIAHVYGHNDFFRNNSAFSYTRPEFTIEIMKARANRVRSYIEDPSIGIEKIEALMDAAHSASLQCRRNLLIKKLNKEEQIKFVFEQFQVPYDPFFGVHKAKKIDNEKLLEALRRNPLESEEDILLFIRDNNHKLEDWQKDILTIVHEEAQYFMPQIETKIMNEGWASFWHREILKSLNLPQELHLEFLVRHNQVLKPAIGHINPYHLGLTVWDSIRLYYDFTIDLALVSKERAEVIEELKSEKVYDDLSLRMQEDFEERDVVPADTGRKSGFQKIFEVRAETTNDVSFLRKYLSPVLMGDLMFFSHKYAEDDQFVYREIDEVATKHTWKEVRDILLQNIGMNTVPIIKVENARFEFAGGEVLYLKHYHDGRDLHSEYMSKTLEYVERLWGGDVMLETVFEGKVTNCLMRDKTLSFPTGK